MYSAPKKSKYYGAKKSKKMPFIWDDRDWKLIGDDEDYDKHRFVVVRKLFVQQKAPFEVSEFMIEFILQSVFLMRPLVYF